MIKVAINGFGRIGRTSFKVWFDRHRDEMEVVAINDLVDAKTLAHLLKYDSNYGVWGRKVEGSDLTPGVESRSKSENTPGVMPDIEGKSVGRIVIDELEVPTFATKDPSKLPWSELMVDVVIESTGKFTDEAGMKKHLEAGAKKVVLSAPAKPPSASSYAEASDDKKASEGQGGGNVATFLLGVNEDKYNGETLINNASCTTNCIAPVAQIMAEKFGVKKAMMTTIHAYTADQTLQDGPHKDLRRARAAGTNIVPTSTGAAIATAQVVPQLNGLFDGVAIRVPVAVGSISDFTFLLEKSVTVEEVNKAITEASFSDRYKGVLAVTEEPVVSSDIVGRPESSIVDLSLTQIVGGDMVKIFAWYDNEYGYSNRLIEQVIQVGKHKG